MTIWISIQCCQLTLNISFRLWVQIHVFPWKQSDSSIVGFSNKQVHYEKRKRWYRYNFWKLPRFLGPKNLQFLFVTLLFSQQRSWTQTKLHTIFFRGKFFVFGRSTFANWGIHSWRVTILNTMILDLGNKAGEINREIVREKEVKNCVANHDGERWGLRNLLTNYPLTLFFLFSATWSIFQFFSFDFLVSR